MACSPADRKVFGKLLRRCYETISSKSGVVLGLSRFTRCFFPKPKVVCIEAWRSRRPRIRKMATDDMFFCKVPFQDIHITTANVCRAPSCIKIVHERHYHAARFYSILLFNNNLYLCSVIEHVTEHLALNSSKTFGQRIKDAVNL